MNEGMDWLNSEDDAGFGDGDDWLGVSESVEVAPDVLRDRLEAESILRKLTNKIHSMSLDDLLLTFGDELRGLFRAERVTIYAMDRHTNEIYSRTSDGDEVKEFRVPVGTRSLAGFVALTGRVLRIDDAYDDAELKRTSPDLSFDISWDQRSGFRTRQVLAAPIKAGRRIEGVIQLVNNVQDHPFSRKHAAILQEVADTLSIAFANQRQLKARRTKWDHLFSIDLVNEEMIDAAREKSQKEGGSLAHYLSKDFSVPKKLILTSLSEFYRVPAVEFSPVAVRQDELLAPFTIDYLKHHLCVPVAFEGEKAVLAMANPKDLPVRDQFAQRLERGVKTNVATEEDVLALIDLFYPAEEQEAPSTERLKALIGEIDIGERADVNLDSKDEVTEESSGLVRLVNKIIEQAYHKGVSDIHIEPYLGGDVHIRFRIDGVCHQHAKLPGKIARAILSRIKIMSSLDIAERRLPQDGKIKFRKYGALDIELRVATLPTVGGLEDCVMRILAASKPLPLDEMGFRPDNLAGFKFAVSQPYGLVLVVGPTGSGKTTTLHSALGFINKPETKIWTAEDPVEITQAGLRQVQVQSKIGFDFARAMRAFLRADPDVIMIGEMRDAETAEAGVEASLTGHLVFSTLHTNSAPETVTRLLDMGLDPYSFGDSLLGILAQRLVRRLCKNCREPYVPEDDEVEELKQEFGNDALWEQVTKGKKPGLFRAPGCRTCGNSGYKGRMGIHEFMGNSDDLRAIVYRKGKISELRDRAISEGMTTLKQDGTLKVLDGYTDMKEVRRVCIR
jgi:type II secretory ATPase GspE/PulE/Tfp pilus assembly ATPase PilB-like protein